MFFTCLCVHVYKCVCLVLCVLSHVCVCMCVSVHALTEVRGQPQMSSLSSPLPCFPLETVFHWSVAHQKSRCWTRSPMDSSVSVSLALYHTPGFLFFILLFFIFLKCGLGVIKLRSSLQQTVNWQSPLLSSKNLYLTPVFYLKISHTKYFCPFKFGK